MELSLLLIQQILKMFIMIVFGYLIVKCKIMKVEESKSLSTITLYIVAPCAIISSFQIELTADKLNGLLLAGLAAIIVHIIYFILAEILKKVFHLTAIEKASIIYSNSGNLIIPLVSAILGDEWVLYSSGYLVVQTILLWTHAKAVVSGERDFSLKKIIFNVNIIAIFIGLILFLTGIQLPSVLQQAIDSVSLMIGPLAMFVIGMLIGNMNFRNIFSDKRTYLVCFLRLIILPLAVVFVLALSGLAMLHKDASQIFIITILAASAPVAATITQFAQIYNKHPGYAGVINVMSVIFCIITMPLMIMIYQLLI